MWGLKKEIKKKSGSTKKVRVKKWVKKIGKEKIEGKKISWN